jgi:hypothetical protein
MQHHVKAKLHKINCVKWDLPVHAYTLLYVGYSCTKKSHLYVAQKSFRVIDDLNPFIRFFMVALPLNGKNFRATSFNGNLTYQIIFLLVSDALIPWLEMYTPSVPVNSRMAIYNFLLSAKVIFWTGSWTTRTTGFLRHWWIAPSWYITQTGTALLLVCNLYKGN